MPHVLGHQCSTSLSESNSTLVTPLNQNLKGVSVHRRRGEEGRAPAGSMGKNPAAVPET